MPASPSVRLKTVESMCELYDPTSYEASKYFGGYSLVTTFTAPPIAEPPNL